MPRPLWRTLFWVVIVLNALGAALTLALLPSPELGHTRAKDGPLMRQARPAPRFDPMSRYR